MDNRETTTMEKKERESITATTEETEKRFTGWYRLTSIGLKQPFRKMKIDHMTTECIF